MVKCAIFYISFRPSNGSRRQPVTLPGGGAVYIRAHVVTCDDPADALDMAQPDADESVMNSHELPQ